MAAGIIDSLLLQLQSILESLSHAFRDLIIAVRVRVESDGLQGFHVHLAVFHLVGFDGGLQHLADNAKTRVVALIFNEFTLQSDGQLVDDGSINQRGFGRGETTLGELVLFGFARHDAKIVGFHHMGCIGDMDDKAFALLDVFNGFVGLGEVKGHAVAVEHSAPSGVHHVDDMYLMFAFCESLENLNLSNFDTKKVVDMSKIFISCFWLNEINISNFIINETTKWSDMFEGCSGLLTKKIRDKIKILK